MHTKLFNLIIADDPQFADLAGSNYRMLDTSPCINYGDSSLVTWSTDLEGQVRIQNGYVDMGAYEIYRMPRGTLFSFR